MRYRPRQVCLCDPNRLLSSLPRFAHCHARSLLPTVVNHSTIYDENPDLHHGLLGLLFFAVHLLNAVSHLGAAWLARRIGLVNTMVFTHLPSSLFLIAAAFAPSLKVAVVLFLCREAFVEMDVPTRQSYVAAVVQPNERTFASGITNLARNVFWAVGSSVAGFLMQNVALSAPLVIGGGAKISYDLLLYRAFRTVKQPEEQ